MKFRVWLLSLLLLSLLVVSVSGVECDSSLSVTPCLVSGDLTLDGGFHNVVLGSGNFGLRIVGGAVFDGNGSVLNSSSSVGGRSCVNVQSGDVVVKDLSFSGCPIGFSITDIVVSNVSLENVVFSDNLDLPVSIFNSNVSGLFFNNLSVQGTVSGSAVMSVESNSFVNGLELFNSEAFNVWGFFFENTGSLINDLLFENVSAINVSDSFFSMSDNDKHQGITLRNVDVSGFSGGFIVLLRGSLNVEQGFKNNFLVDNFVSDGGAFRFNYVNGGVFNNSACNGVTGSFGTLTASNIVFENIVSYCGDGDDAVYILPYPSGIAENFTFRNISINTGSSEGLHFWSNQSLFDNYGLTGTVKGVSNVLVDGVYTDAVTKIDYGDNVAFNNVIFDFSASGISDGFIVSEANDLSVRDSVFYSSSLDSCKRDMVFKPLNKDFVNVLLENISFYGQGFGGAILYEDTDVSGFNSNFTIKDVYAENYARTNCGEPTVYLRSLAGVLNGLRISGLTIDDSLVNGKPFSLVGNVLNDGYFENVVLEDVFIKTNNTQISNYKDARNVFIKNFYIEGSFSQGFDTVNVSADNLVVNCSGLLSSGIGYCNAGVSNGYFNNSKFIDIYDDEASFPHWNGLRITDNRDNFGFGNNYFLTFENSFISGNMLLLEDKSSRSGFYFSDVKFVNSDLAVNNVRSNSLDWYDNNTFSGSYAIPLLKLTTNKVSSYGGDTWNGSGVIGSEFINVSVSGFSKDLFLDGLNSPHGMVLLNSENVTFKNFDVEELVVNGSGFIGFGNTFRGVISDLVVGSKFCDYSSNVDNFYIGGSYSGVNIGGCPKFSEFYGFSTTDFSIVNNWSSVDLVLENDKGLVDWVSNVDLSGLQEVDFDSCIDVIQDKISVDSGCLGSSDLNSSASLVFKNVNALNVNVIKVYSDKFLNFLCQIGLICLNTNYDKVSKTYSMDVTHFSAYELDYEVVLEDSDTMVAFWDVLLKILVGFGVLAGVLGLYFGLRIVFNLFNGRAWDYDLRFK